MPHSFGLLDGGQEFGLRDTAVETLHLLAGLVVDQGYREPVLQFVLLNDSVGAYGYGVVDGVLLEEGGHFGGGIVVHRNADEGDALRAELVVELVEEWEFADAGDAIGGPE